LGKPYATELKALSDTYALSCKMHVDTLAAILRSGVHLPLAAIGSGGSLTSAHFAAYLHTLYTGRMAKAMTPLEIVSSPAALQHLAVLILSAGGRNPDVLGCFDSLQRRDHSLLGAVCAQTETPLAEKSIECKAPFFEFDLPSGKDGFLATNTLLATCVLMARGYRQAWSATETLPSSFDALLHPGKKASDFFDGLRRQSAVLWERETTLILHGYATQPAAIDLESKFTEAAIGHAQIADYRNFAHGRHHWLARYGEKSGVLALVTPSEREVAEKTLGLLPKEIAVFRVSLPEGGVNGSLAAIALAIYLAGFAGEARGIDPGRPTVPTFGRKIYHLSAMPRRESVAGIDQDEAAAIECKAQASISTLSAQGRLQSWRDAYAAFLDALGSASFDGIVFDYDGTLCDASERFTGLHPVVSEQLIRLLAAGINVGIATGRGKSVRHDLRQALTNSAHWNCVLVGYHNGSEIALLDDESQPPRGNALVESLRPVRDALKAHAWLTDFVKIKGKNRQITLEGMPTGRAEEAWALIEELLRDVGSRGVMALRSGHSIDLLAPGVSKRAVLERMRSAFPGTGNILCIGDRGRWPGNDFSLLSEPMSLSVDEASGDKTTCWNLAVPSKKCVEATLYYLSAIRPKSRRFTIKLKRHSS
jgi:hydroxymethylpyrimidine pyrophosphatase-like HAD family hydrolase/fructoselysine-6-P-deglycase FrlB-like protein